MSIKIEHIETFNWEGAVRGARNPMNSWDKSDSYFDLAEDPSPINPNDEMIYRLGENDLKLLKKLANAGSDHRKFMRQIFVCMDITAPLYWWKEMDQFKVGTTTDSCSTMHKIASKEFTVDDFSHEHLCDECLDILNDVIDVLNDARDGYVNWDRYRDCANLEEWVTGQKALWWQMIQLLPSSYNQKRTWTGSYENLANIYHSRKNHKLDEWVEFCKVIETMPYAKELIVREENEK